MIRVLHCSAILSYPHYVLHKREFEHCVKLDLLIFQDVLQTALVAVFCEYALIWRVNAGTNEPHDVVVLQIAHLKPAQRVYSYSRSNAFLCVVTPEGTMPDRPPRIALDFVSH